MTGQNLNFDFLTRETLALTDQLREDSSKKNRAKRDSAYFLKDSILDNSEQLKLELFEEPLEFTHSNKECEDDCEQSAEVEIAKAIFNQEVPVCPGVVYYLEKGASTFCLRGISSADMQWEREALERFDPSVMKSLRISDQEEVSGIGFFPTYDEAFAETIIDQLMNRRFPHQEAIVCNISDPGFSWWLSCENKSFEVYFQSHGIERDENLIQLGPLGDPFIAFQFFKKSFNFLKSYFSINEFSATQKGLKISCASSSSEEFQQLIELFIDGEFPWGDSVFNDKSSPNQDLLLYFYEISLLRKFWIGVQDRIN